jgi:DNA-binding GntR family transcriptional regulator
MPRPGAQGSDDAPRLIDHAGLLRQPPKPLSMTAASSSAPRRDSANVATVHERLRTAILRGELEPGAIIPQGTLAAAFDAGRTPLREALRMLQREGLVISEPNRPVRIAPLSREDFEEVYIMRIALETVAVHITVPTLASSDFADLEGFLAQMDHYQKAGDQAGFRAPHRAFHHRLIAGSGLRVSTQIDELADHSERYRLRFGDSLGWQKHRKEHREILDAAAAHDADLAAERLAAHYARIAALVFKALDPERNPDRLRCAVEAVAPSAATALRRRPSTAK